MHLDVRSWFSFHDGVASPDQLCAHAAELGFPSLGVADVNGTYGLVGFYKAAVKHGIRPVLGLTLTAGPLDTPGHSDATPPGHADWARHGSEAAESAASQPGAVTLLARDREGYSQLCDMAAQRQLTPRFDLARAILGTVTRCFVITDRADIVEQLAPYFGPSRMFVRLAPNYGPAYRARQLAQLKLAARHSLHPVACTAVRFVRPQDQALHHVLRAIGGNATLQTATGVCPRDHYLAAPTELPGYYYDCPEALTLAQQLAERCDVEIELGKWVFPDFPLKDGADPRRKLGELCRAALARLPEAKRDRRYISRLDMELGVIERLGYTSYFLAVYDIVRESKRLRIPCLGRGSAANSIVSYLLGLTPVDPIVYDMYFERFLNPERTSPPDIDIDFNWRRRDEIVEYVYRRWGDHRVAMISTHVTFRAKSALREVAKTFGLGDKEISAVSRHLPAIGAGGLESMGAQFPELRGIDLSADPYRQVLPLAARLAGRPRHLGIHCGGIVVAPTKITDYTGLQRAAKGLVVTQYDMFPVEDIGLIKIDLLGNRSLGVLEDSLRELARRPRDLPSAPADRSPGTLARIRDWHGLTDDARTVEMLRSGDTMGCFYTESPGMRQLLRRLDTHDFLQLTAASSVIRPGVADSGMMQEYIRRQRGLGEKMQSHPAMLALLKETHGVMIYQEDVIRVAHELAGMSLAQADLLRRAMSGKLRSYHGMNEVRDSFIAGCGKNGLDLEAATVIWTQIASFAGYSFCKAHSASFATLSLQVLYLKAHHPAVFMAAVLANGGGFYGPRAYLSECERLGLAVLPPDVNYSQLSYSAEYHRAVPPAEPDGIRVGLGVVKGVSVALLTRIVTQRERVGPLRTLPEFVRRTRPGEADLDTLIRCGALDSLGLTRPELLWLARSERAAALRHDRRRGNDDSEPPALLPLDERARLEDFRRRVGAGLDDYDELKLCALEQELYGMVVRRHPLSIYRPHVGGVVDAADIAAHIGQRVCMLGWCIATKRVDLSRRKDAMDILAMQALHSDMPEQYDTDDEEEGEERTSTAADIGLTRSGEEAPGYYGRGGPAMKFMSLEDLSGTFEATLFADAYARFAPLTRYSGPFILTGRVEEQFGTCTLNVTHLRLLQLTDLPDLTHMGHGRADAVRGAGRGRGN